MGFEEIDKGQGLISLQLKLRENKTLVVDYKFSEYPSLMWLEVKVSIPLKVEGYEFIRITIRRSDFRTYIDKMSVQPLKPKKREELDKKKDSYFQNYRRQFLNGYQKRDLDKNFSSVKAPNHALMNRLAELQRQFDALPPADYVSQNLDEI